MPAPTAATILVLEEEPQLLQLLREILVRAGHRVLRASSAEEALRLYEQHGASVDLLVVDAFLPEVEALTRRHPGLKVLALSPRTLGGGPPECPILHKPFAPDDLLALIRWLLSGSTDKP